MYVFHNIGGRGLIAAHYVVEHEKRNLYGYVHATDDLYMSLVAATLPKYEESADQYKHRACNDHLVAWQDKPLHGQFLWQVSNVLCPKTQWSWLKFGKITKEMEGLIFAAQEQALSTKAIQSNIYMLSTAPNYVMCQMRQLNISLVVVPF